MIFAKLIKEFRPNYLGVSIELKKKIVKTSNFNKSNYYDWELIISSPCMKLKTRASELVEELLLNFYTEYQKQLKQNQKKSFKIPKIMSTNEYSANELLEDKI